MNLRFALRNLSRRRSRTVTGVLGIFITLALLTTVQVTLDSISVGYTDLVSLQAGKADILVSREGNHFWNPRPFEPSATRGILEAAPEVKGVSPRLMGIVRVQYSGGEVDAVLAGLDLEREKLLDISGVTPAPSGERGSCALSAALAGKLNAKPGARIRLSSADGYAGKELTFEALLKRQQILPQQVRDYVVVNLEDARELLGLSSEVHLLAGGLRNPGRFYNARDIHGSVMRLKGAGAELASALGMEYEVRLPKAAALTVFQDFTSPLRAVFGVFALLALVITGLLIYSLLSVAVEERIREYAILRTIGATRGGVQRLVLGESFLFCCLGVLPGVAAGALAAKGLVALVGLGMGGTAGAIAVDLRLSTLVLTFGAGAVLALCSALVPAFQSTRWSIADALDPLRRGQIAEPSREAGNQRPLVWAGTCLSALAGVVFFVLPGALFSGNPSLIGTIVLCLLLAMLLGLTMVSVGVQPLLQRVLLALIGRLFGPASDLAGRNLRRHRRRHVTTALLFSLSVSLVVYVASLVALISRTAMSLVELTHGADLRIHSPQAGGSSLKPELMEVEGVTAVSQSRYLHSRSEYGTAYDVVVRDLVGMKHLWVVPYGADPDLAKVLYGSQVQFEAGAPSALAELCAWEPASDADTRRTDASYPPVILSLAAARFLEVAVGDAVEFTFRLGAERSDARFRVTGICRTMPGFENFRGRVAHAVGSGVLMPESQFRRHTRAAPPEALQALYFAKTEAGAEAQKEAARRVREQFGMRHRFSVKCTAEQKQEAQGIYWATQIFFGFLLGVAVTIAVFALIASMATTVMERRHEIGVLKSLGMLRSELFRMFLGESVTLTLASGIAGGAIGFVLAWLFVMQAAMLMEIPVVFTLPYVTLAATLVVSLVSGALAAYLPTRSLLRKQAAEILR